MGGVSLVCTFIVIAIILIAVVLSQSAFPRSDSSISNVKLVYLVPQPRMYSERTPTILLHRDHPIISQTHVSELTLLLKTYREKQGSSPMASACDLRYAPTGGSSCYFPLEKISDNCSANNNFGYDSASPCVALVFNSLLGWLPQPFSVSNPNEIPEDIRSEYDPRLVYVTCRCNVTTYGNFSGSSPMTIAYSPFHGFPLHFLSAGATSARVPPLVMVQFLGLKSQSEIHVICSFWAKNVPKNAVDDDGTGSIRFTILNV